MRPEVVVCSIGCTDPWNAAGLGLDIRALAARGARPVSVVAGVTAQDSHGVHAAAPVAPELIAAQLAALAGAGIAAYRVGALLDVASVVAVAAALARVTAPVVYDPVLAPSAGGSFAGDATVDAIRTRLLGCVTLVTPNLPEAKRLTGSGEAVSETAAMEAAAVALRSFGAGAALVTGGHLAGDPVDVLADETGVHAYRGSRLPGTLRGTGCLLACAIAVELARAVPLRAAVERGRALVRERFERGTVLDGMRLAY
jgi:hydroxymethylpyrimidine/phosphomethylpyrimidine kinase